MTSSSSAAIENNSSDPHVHMTDVTIETNVDPHDETTTTTTTVHLPFQITQQCPPPKVISWMKSRKPATTATATIRSSNKKQPSRPHHHSHHHHSSSRHNRTVGKVQQLLPFLTNKRRNSNAADKTKKGDQSITVFSIQVNILGKVLVPPCPSSLAPTASSTSISQKSVSTPSTASLSTPEHDGADLAPVKTLPAQVTRSATTSYVIHRTFEDFQRLSEMVLNLQGALMTAPGSIPQGPELKALAVRHPHAGLYQALLKQFSQAKANQRAFDASSTTHGFNEEGAFERILELNQYLEDIWFWLLPENTPEALNLSVERHDIMQWLKPSASSSHADGRQMRERSDQPLKTAMRSSPQITSITVASPIDIATIEAVESEIDAMALSTASLNGSPEYDLSSELKEADKVEEEVHDQLQQDGATRAPERMSSVSSLPSLSSSSSISESSTTSMTTMSEVGGNDLKEEAERNSDRLHQGLDRSNNSDVHHLEVVMQGSPHTLSTMASSTLAASSDVLDLLDNHHGNDAVIATPTTPTVMIDTPGDLPSFSRHGTLPRRRLRRTSQQDSDSSVSPADVKLKRRMSFSQVFKSLTMPISSNHRHSHYDAGTSREVFDEDIYIWNTVTTKNLPKHAVVA